MPLLTDTQHGPHVNLRGAIYVRPARHVRMAPAATAAIDLSASRSALGARPTIARAMTVRVSGVRQPSVWASVVSDDASALREWLLALGFTSNGG